MDFSEILRDLLVTPSTTTSTQYHHREIYAPIDNNKKLCLSLSHGNSVHEIFFTEWINQFLQKYISSIQPYGYGNTLEEQDLSTKCIVICFHKSWDIYRKLLNPIYANNTLLTKQCLHIIDISVILQEILLSNRLEENRNNSNLDVNTGDIIKRYIKDKMDELLNNTTALDHSKSIQQNIGIFIDNISSLYDLGVSLRELEYLLSNWFYSPDSNTNISNLLVSIGVHVGENFQDSITSEFEPGFIHFIDLWRSRASIILESKPLTTGYTSLIDGQLILRPEKIDGEDTLKRVFRPNIRSNHLQENSSKCVHNPLICWKRSTLDRLNCKNNITSSVYHFHVEGKRINCYTPGTSKLLT